MEDYARIAEINNAIEAFRKTQRGTVVLPTGVGKTSLALKVAKDYNKVLIIVPTTYLKEQWEKQTPHKVVVKNSAHKETDEYDLLIIDEIHTVCSPVFQRVFKLKYSFILGLTATVPEKEYALEILNQNCPVVYHRELKELEKGILSDYEIFLVPSTLNRKERAKYKIFDANLNKAQRELYKYKRKYNIQESVFDIAEKYSKEEGEITPVAKAFWSSMTMRKSVLYTAESKIETIQKILSKYPNRKWIFFNKSVELADKIQKALEDKYDINTVHYKVDEKVKEKLLEEFLPKKVGILNTVDGMVAGADIPHLSGGISVSYASTELPMIQSLGRVIRKEGEKESLFFNIYSKDTQEKTWVLKKVRNLKWTELPL